MNLVFSGERLFAGTSETMSFLEDRTPLLWRSFMPRRNQIPFRKSALLYSLQVYPQGLKHFSQPGLSYQKYALMEVTAKGELPEGFSYFTLPAGQYACMEHIGGSRGAEQLFSRIFSQLLPEAGLEVDERPFFEELEEDYLSKGEQAKELIWIPVRKIDQNQVR